MIIEANPNNNPNKLHRIIVKHPAINVGKVKTVYEVDGEADKVMIEYHDKVTAFDGKKTSEPSEKGKVCCLISALLFEYLEKQGIRTHYIDCPSLNTMLCKKLTIVPVEVIVRNIAAGSIVKNTTMKEGTIISPELVEYFLKDDSLGDPLLTQDRLRLMGIDPEPMYHIAKDINLHLQQMFTLLGLDLVDFKLEFGYDAHGDLYVADEISPDSMRLWEKNSGMSKDKDIFRKYGSDEALVAAYGDILKGLRQFAV